MFNFSLSVHRHTWQMRTHFVTGLISLWAFWKTPQIERCVGKEQLLSALGRVGLAVKIREQSKAFDRVTLDIGGP
ncbi:hypothetical protein GCM10025859_41620 [Alicyclobacillus fastidiosus]|nr:hypothetical protein GCM10025859_41620 [Alicyclobacillus fastidiosus]